VRTSLAYRLLRKLPEAIRRRVYLREMGFDPDEINGLRFKLAELRWEREQAFRLLHDMYVRRGILDPEQNKMRFSPYSVLPDTALFVAVRDQKVLGTMTLVEDSPIGLPMEDTHPEEIANLRARGGRLAEVGGLAVTEEGRGKGMALMMYNLMFRWASEHRRVAHLAIAVHPSAADYYETILLFERLGPTRQYKSLKEAPSAPCALALGPAVPRFRTLYDRDRSQRATLSPRRNLYRFFCEERIANLELEREMAAPPPWTELELKYFVEQLDARPRGLPLSQGKLLLHHYPFLITVFYEDGRSRTHPGGGKAERPAWSSTPRS
jgi:hypothetical protein